MSTFLLIFIHVVALSITCNSEKIRFFALEHAAVDGINLKYATYARLTAQRYGRKDPFYYVGFSVNMVYEFHNNLTASFYFFEFLTNRYARSFVEVHWKICDLIWKDNIFGIGFRQGRLDRPCPFPAGPYDLRNITIPMKSIPANFPFKKGRIYCNVTRTEDHELLGWAHVDFEIKEVRVNGTHRNWTDLKKQPEIVPVF